MAEAQGKQQEKVDNKVDFPANNHSFHAAWLHTRTVYTTPFFFSFPRKYRPDADTLLGAQKVMRRN
jgi:hypothetical protein